MKARVGLCAAAGVLAYMLAQALSVRSSTVLAGSKEGARAGAVLFKESGCQYCHGINGVGTEKGPSLASIGRKWERPLIENQITKGGGGMPAFEELKPEELSALLDYLQTKRAKEKK